MVDQRGHVPTEQTLGHAGEDGSLDFPLGHGRPVQKLPADHFVGDYAFFLEPAELGCDRRLGEIAALGLQEVADLSDGRARLGP